MTLPSFNIDDLAARVVRLERENRKLKRVGLAVLAAAACAVLMAQAHGRRVVEAESFVLKDSTGKTRAVLHMAKIGPGVTIGADGKVKQESQEPVETGPALTFTDKDGKLRVILGVKRDWDGDSAELSLLDQYGNARAGLAVHQDGSPSVRLGQ